MKQLKSVRNYVFGRFTLDQVIVLMIVLIIESRLLDAAVKVGILSMAGIIIELIALAILIVYGLFFFKESTLYNSKAMILHLLRGLMGDNKMNKYAHSAEYIKKKIPIEEIHENGMIEFPKGEWGILMTQILPNITPQGRAAYLSRTEDIINPLPLGIIYKSMRFCSIETAQPLVDQVRDAINDPDTTDEMREHLYDSYEQLKNVHGRIIWSAWGFIGVGKYKDAEAAYIGSKVEAESIMKSLRDADIIPMRMTNEYTIINVYRQMLSMKVVF